MYSKLSEYLTKSQVLKSCFPPFYKNTRVENKIGAWLNANKITEKAVKQNFWKYVPLFVKIQYELLENNQKSFNVVPIYFNELKYIAYDSMFARTFT